MRVYKPQAYEDLVAPLESTIKDKPLKTTTSRLRMSRSAGQLGGRNSKSRQERFRAAKMIRNQKYWEVAEKEQEEYEFEKKKIRAQNKDYRQQEFDQMLAKLDSEADLVRDVEAYLELKGSNSKRNKERLHRQWSQEVYQPIQKRVERHLSKTATSDIEARNRAAFDGYIEAANTSGVFRDIINEEQYKPLERRTQTGKYRTHDLADPLKKDLISRRQEANLMSTGSGKAEKATNRQMLDLLLWDKLDCTPYARYNAPPKERHPPPGVQSSHKSTLVMDHYKVNKDLKLAKSQYFPGGKYIPEKGKRLPPYGYNNPSGYVPSHYRT